MHKIFVFIAIASTLSGSYVSAQTTQTTETTQITTTTESNAPTEVGTTTLPPGQYSLTEVSNGKKYSLTVTDKGTMIAASSSAPVATSSSSTSSKIKSLAEKQIESQAGSFVEKQGINELKNFIK